MNSTLNIRAKEGQKMTLDQLIESYLRACKLQSKTTATLKWYVRRLGHFKAFVQTQGSAMMAKDLALDDGERYVIALMEQNHRWPQHPYSPPKAGSLSKFTVHGHVRAIRALTNWATLNGYLQEDPFARLPVPKLPKKLIEILSEEEIERLFKAADSLEERGVRVRTILVVLLDTAIRAEELCGLKMDVVDLDQGRCTGAFDVGDDADRLRRDRCLDAPAAEHGETGARRLKHRPQGMIEKVVMPWHGGLFLVRGGAAE